MCKLIYYEHWRKKNNINYVFYRNCSGPQSAVWFGQQSRFGNRGPGEPLLLLKSTKFTGDPLNFLTVNNPKLRGCVSPESFEFNTVGKAYFKHIMN